MTLWQTSLTYQIWVWLCDVYEDSTLHRFLAAAGRWCSGQIEESRILRLLCREGIVARSWKDSFLCRVLSALVNLPGTLLHAWYKAWNLTFEDSFFARLAFDMGDSASIAQSWCIAALWCIPYERWNNAYSFMTGVLLLLLFYAGAMRTGRRLDVARIGFYPALMLAAAITAPLPMAETLFWLGRQSAQEQPASSVQVEAAPDSTPEAAASSLPQAVQALTGNIEDYLVPLLGEEARPADAGTVIEKNYPQGSGEKYIPCGAGSIKNNTRQTAADIAAV